VSNSISEPRNHRRPHTRSTILPAARALILCVERDPHVRELEAYFLDEAGFAVHFAEDGESALELARSLKPAIIITEILVAKRDGLALCRELKECAETKDTPILVFSLLAAEARAREAGATAFLKKPLAEHRLVDTVCELLRSHAPRKRDDRDERSRK
jgi:DNA-binding response OmpR family regulator